MYTHGYNISLVDLVDRIDSPLVKEAMLHRTYKKLDSWPTPADYTKAINNCEQALVSASDKVSGVVHSKMLDGCG